MASHSRFEAYCQMADQVGFAPEIVEEVDFFRFGASRAAHKSTFLPSERGFR